VRDFLSIPTHDGFPETRRAGYPRFEERLGTGLASLDRLMEGGYRRGTATLFSGAPGTSKTTFCCHFVHQACFKGETVV